MRNLLPSRRMVSHRGKMVRPSDLPEPPTDSLTWNSTKRPHDPRLCLLRDCGRPATCDGLCFHHDAIYRVKCETCGKHIRNEVALNRGYCGRCWWALSQAKRLEIMGREE